MLRHYEKPSDENIEKRLSKNWPATPQMRASTGRGQRGQYPYQAPTPVTALARGRVEPTAAAAEEGEPLTPTAVVAPQTTNNFFDNRSTNIMRPALDARNREAGVVALQNLQGLTAALG